MTRLEQKRRLAIAHGIIIPPMPLDLLVPDLLLPADAPFTLRASRLPSLEKWLARSDMLGMAGRDSTQWLASAYGLPLPPSVAAIALAGEGPPQDGAWMRADPVHLRIDHDYLKLHDASILEVTREESELLVAALQSHFRADGLEFRAGAADRWYVRLPESELPHTTPLEHALGRDVFGLLPAQRPGAGGKINWRSAITEAQMVLAAHEVNAAREAAGKLAINSVWFWGEGSVSGKLARPYALVYADEAFARGLGVLSGADVRPLAKGIAAVDLVREGESVLAVIGGLTPALRRGEASAWQATADALDAGWFASLGEAIERFDRVRLILPAPKDTRVATLTAASRWRWFRTRKPLAAHA